MVVGRGAMPGEDGANYGLMADSYWHRDATFVDRWVADAVPGRADYLVIGGGLAGLATALELRKRDARAVVVVLEGERVGYGASGRNAGLLSPVPAPIWLLGADRDPDKAWAANWVNAEVHRLAGWIREAIPDAELAHSRLGIASTNWLTDAGLGEFARCLDRVGLAYDLVSGRVRTGHLSLEMDAHTVHPYKLVLGLARLAVQRGITLCERAPVTGIESMRDGVKVRLRGGESLVANRVVVCTNGYTESLPLKERLGALTTRSFMIASAPNAALARAQWVGDGDFTVEINRAETYHRRHRDRVLYGGGDVFIVPGGEDCVVPAATTSRLSQRMQRSYPAIDARASDMAWSGRLHVTPVGLPIIRASFTRPRVILNVGYGGTGVAMTLMCAPLAAALAQGGDHATAEHARLAKVIAETKIPLWDGLRAAGRVAGRLAWRK